MGSGGPPPPPPSPEVAQYLARLSTPLAPNVQTIASTLIDGLVAQAAWTNLDRLVCPFLPEVQADALIDLKNPSPFPGNATEVGSPTWTEKLGYTFNGSSNYIDTNFAPSISGSSFTLNNSSFGVFIPAHAGAISTTNRSGCVDGTANNALFHFPRFSDSDPRAQIQSSAQISSSFPATNGVGFFVVNRSTSTAAQFYKNGVAGGTSANLSGGLATRVAYIGAYNNNGSAAGFHNAQYAAWLFSNSKNAATWLAVYNLLNNAYTARQST